MNYVIRFINELPHYLDNVLKSPQVTLNPVKLNDGNCLIEEIIFQYVLKVEL